MTIGYGGLLTQRVPLWETVHKCGITGRHRGICMSVFFLRLLRHGRNLLRNGGKVSRNVQGTAEGTTSAKSGSEQTMPEKK